MSPIKKFVLILCCGAFFCALDSGSFLVQVGAWAKMAYSFSQHDSVKVALQKTFDGQHPCPVCKQIAKQSANLPQLKVSTLGSKLKSLLTASAPTLKRVYYLGTHYQPHVLVYTNSICLTPPTPPPRFV